MLIAVVDGVRGGYLVAAYREADWRRVYDDPSGGLTICERREHRAGIARGR